MNGQISVTAGNAGESLMALNDGWLDNGSVTTVNMQNCTGTMGYWPLEPVAADQARTERSRATPGKPRRPILN